MSQTTCGGDGGRFNRRAALATLGAGFGLAFGAAPAHGHAKRAPVRPEDEGFMRLAIAEAAKGDFPFGAVIVRDGKVVSTGRNLGVTNNDPTAHGEMVAIRRFVADNPAKDLKGATLYTSGEPCPMCMGAIVWCGIARVVFGASIAELATKIGQIMVPDAEIAAKTPFAEIALTGGVLAEESLKLFK